MNPIANHNAAPSTSKIGQRTATVRYLIVGIAILALAVTHLIITAADWSSAPSGGFLNAHALQLAGVIIGTALVVVGIVKAVRR